MGKVSGGGKRRREEDKRSRWDKDGVHGEMLRWEKKTGKVEIGK